MVYKQMAIYEYLAGTNISNYRPESWKRIINHKNTKIIFIDILPENIPNSHLIPTLIDKLQSIYLDTKLEYVGIFSERHNDMESDLVLIDHEFGWEYKWTFLQFTKKYFLNILNQI
jgi:hypothetical protein